MSDMKPIDEQTDLDRAKARVALLEQKLTETTEAHNAKFPPGVTSDKERASQAHLGTIKFDLDQARWRLGFVEMSAERRRIVEAKEANAGIPKNRLFEVKAPRDGRILRHHAHSQAQLTGELEIGYEIVAEVFGAHPDGTGGVVVSTDANVPTLLDGILAAFGPELLKWLGEQGVMIRRGAPPTAA